MCQSCCCGCSNVNKTFPVAGDLFTARVSSGSDRSYEGSVFECVVSDAGTVVAKKVVGYSSGNKPNTFGRHAWTFTPSSQCVVNAAR
jgi:hypothetical protein